MDTRVGNGLTGGVGLEGGVVGNRGDLLAFSFGLVAVSAAEISVGGERDGFGNLTAELSVEAEPESADAVAADCLDSEDFDEELVVDDTPLADAT